MHNLTTQLEFDFHDFAHVAIIDLMAFSFGVTADRVAYLPFYQKLQTQAQDLTRYAYSSGSIDFETYISFSDSILKASDLFWS